MQKQDTLKDHWPSPRDEPRQLSRAAGPVPGSGRPGSEGSPHSCMLLQGNPQLQAHLQSRAGLDPGLPWQQVLEPSQAEPSSPVTPRLPGPVGRGPPALVLVGRQWARHTADCCSHRLAIRTRHPCGLQQFLPCVRASGPQPIKQQSRGED